MSNLEVNLTLRVVLTKCTTHASVKDTYDGRDILFSASYNDKVDGRCFQVGPSRGGRLELVSIREVDLSCLGQERRQ
jgi:hypothetical protein